MVLDFRFEHWKCPNWEWGKGHFSKWAKVLDRYALFLYNSDIKADKDTSENEIFLQIGLNQIASICDEVSFLVSLGKPHRAKIVLWKTQGTIPYMVIESAQLVMAGSHYAYQLPKFVSCSSACSSWPYKERWRNEQPIPYHDVAGFRVIMLQLSRGGRVL